MKSNVRMSIFVLLLIFLLGNLFLQTLTLPTRKCDFCFKGNKKLFIWGTHVSEPLLGTQVLIIPNAIYMNRVNTFKNLVQLQNKGKQHMCVLFKAVRSIRQTCHIEIRNLRVSDVIGQYSQSLSLWKLIVCQNITEGFSQEYQVKFRSG